MCPCIVNTFPNYNQRDAMFLDLFINFYKRSTCFRRFLRSMDEMELMEFHLLHDSSIG